MRPVSGAALGVAALITSPALAAAATGALPVDVAMTRYLLAAGLCWVLLAVAEEWWWPGTGTASSSVPSRRPLDPPPAEEPAATQEWSPAPAPVAPGPDPA